MTNVSSKPRVTHFNDCANVAQALVQEAANQGLKWGYLPPSKVRPSQGFGSGVQAKIHEVPYLARHLLTLLKSDVMHIHYATAAALLEHGYFPRRPYLLHLHGTDIRRQWLDPHYRPQIQRAIDQAHTVFYTNLDTAENATAARSDARYMPALLSTSSLPAWQPQSDKSAARVIFASRWDDSKGVSQQLEIAEKVITGFPKIEVLGLDWGPGAAHAATLGVRLVPKLEHQAFLDFLASADAVVGQATGLLGISELEAMSIGVPVICPGEQLIGPAGKPPVLQGSTSEILAELEQVLRSPRETATLLNAPQWVVNNHTAGPWIPELERLYQEASTS